MQIKIGGRKTDSYYGFLKAIGERNLPGFDSLQEDFVDYVSEMLPLVRMEEYLILQKLIETGSVSLEAIRNHVEKYVPVFHKDVYDHALDFMLRTKFFVRNNDVLSLKDGLLDVEMQEYLQDLLEYGLSKYEIDYGDKDPTALFKIWGKYRKDQVQLLLLKNPHDIMLGTKNYDGVVYAYVTVLKGSSVQEALNYADGYIDRNTFQWETVAHVSDKELYNLKHSKRIELFVRKVESENNVVLPFTYIGSGHMEFVENSRKENGAYLFRVPMDQEAPEDLYFDFKLPEK